VTAVFSKGVGEFVFAKWTS